MFYACEILALAVDVVVLLKSKVFDVLCFITFDVVVVVIHV